MRVSLEPGDSFETRSSLGKVKRFTVKDDGSIKVARHPVGFQADCQCDRCTKE